MWVDGMSFARIAGQFDAVKALTTTTHRGQHDGEENPRPGSMRTGRVRPAHFAHEYRDGHDDEEAG